MKVTVLKTFLRGKVIVKPGMEIEVDKADLAHYQNYKMIAAIDPEEVITDDGGQHSESSPTQNRKKK